ncbi:hypothetical protein Val02_00400 [Virgisporangium aliadipatigenens]|uniref:HTH luxR-type domain-containing protein n=1 Tax=Virgisporangium aliadipatigenens TaxID=741659 RepID=A0A8J3YDJ8_9ACTN|nr:helix-turn-helix transcriptional regulator [Virgisporangium aliadipatigenens]GIJ43154.1 hypothetical protein Val02_00400 [Virgisporangium aliadipatigenens]
MREGGPDDFQASLDAGAQALYERGDLQLSRQLYDAAYRAAERAGDVDATARAALGAAGLWAHEHRNAAAAALVEVRLKRAADAVDPHSPLGLRLRIRLAGEADYRTGGPGSIRGVLEEARRGGDPVALAEALTLAHHSALGPAHRADRHAWAEELVRVATQTGRRSDPLMGRLCHTIDLYLDGDPHAGRHLRTLRGQLDEHDHLAIAYVLSALEVMLEIRAGRLDRAEELAAACAERGTLAGDQHVQSWFGGHLVAIRWFQGRIAELAPMLSELADAPTLSTVDNSPLAALATAAASAGDRLEAAGALARLRGRSLADLPQSSTWLTSMYGLIEAAHLTGDRALSAQAYELLQPYAARPMMAGPGISCFGSVRHALGVAALTAGAFDRAIAHLREALDDNLALGHYPAAVLSRWRLRQALVARGAPGDAEAALEATGAAGRDATRLGMMLPGAARDAPLGRDRERADLRAMLRDARAGRSSSVVLRGEAGIGKTTLLDDLAADAHGFRVVRVVGVEFESDLPFAALTALTRPLVRFLDDVPRVQAEAFRAATGTGTARPPDRLTVYAATVSLLAAAAEKRPLLCLVDDAQWLDRASTEALLFAGRRLLAEGVTMVFAARDVPRFEAPGLAELTLDGLDESAGTALLRRNGVSSDLVARTLVSMTNGNPLALAELPRVLSEEQKSGQAPLLDELPTTERLERAFADRVAALPAQGRSALLVCAIAGEVAPETIEPALAALGLESGPVDEAVRAGLLRRVAGVLTFRHPLVRSAVYHRATPDEKRAVHAVLAAVHPESEEDDRRVWHLAHAASGTDEEVAAALARAGVRARRRGGLVAEATAFERSAALTADPVKRGARLAQAARAWTGTGKIEYAAGLLDKATPLVAGSARHRCDVLAQRAHLAMLRGEPALLAEPGLFDTITAEAERAAPEAPQAAGLMLSMAMTAPLSRWDVATALRTGERALALASPHGPGTRNPEVAVRLAFAQVLAGLPDGPRLARRCVPVSVRADDHGACAALAEVLTWIGDTGVARQLVEHDVDAARRVGDVSLLAFALTQRAHLLLRTGRLAAACADALEAAELAEATGQPGSTAAARAVLARVCAAQGRHAESAAHAAVATALLPHHLGIEAAVRLAAGSGALATGRFADAVAELSTVDDILRSGGVVEPAVFPVGGDLAEALLRVDRRADALGVLRRLETAAARTGRVAARASASRTRALLADDPEPHFKEALDGFSQVDAPLETARTELYYGRWLRRGRRRQHARERLERARDAFEGAGAVDWAQQAASELSPSSSRRTPGPQHGAAEELTAHEWRIAYAAAQGRTSREIAAQVLLSVRTVEYHLGAVYRKLGIRSRRELAERLGSAP